jgi:hypothetical protein
LLALWHQLRDRELHWPWYERDLSAIRRITPNLDAARMNAMTLDSARQLAHYGDLSRASWRVDLAPLLAQVSHAVLLFKDADDPRLTASLKAKRRLPAAQLLKRPLTPDAWAGTLIKFWGGLDKPS